MHLDAEQIERLLSGELSEQRLRAQRDHLARCDACAEAYEEAARRDTEIAALLRRIDHTPPRIDPAVLQRRARRRVMRSRLAAAGIVIFLAVGAASAMPGSPIRSWISSMTGRGDEGTALPGGVQATDSARIPSGVSVPATDGFELVFETMQEAGLVTVILADEPEVSIRSDDAGVGYAIEPWGVRVMNGGSVASYQVVVPSEVQDFSIRVESTTVFRKRGRSIETSVKPDSAGRYIIDFGASPGDV